MENLRHSFTFLAFCFSCLPANFQFSEVMFANDYGYNTLQVNSNVEFLNNPNAKDSL